MPNWCWNEVQIIGNNNVIDRLKQAVKSDRNCFDFNKVIPYPEEYRNNGGYQWCIDNWGTKWEANEPVVKRSYDGTMYAMFSTAWSPSIPVTAKLAEIFPELHFEHCYEEGGNDFSGVATFIDGECIGSLEGTYDEYPLSEHEPNDEEEDENETI